MSTLEATERCTCLGIATEGDATKQANEFLQVEKESPLKDQYANFTSPMFRYDIVSSLSVNFAKTH